MSLIPIASLANGTVYKTVPFVGPQNPTGAALLTPAAGQQVHVYAHKTTTPASVYTDEAGLSPASQPLVSGADGSVPGFIDPATLPLDLVVNGETYELPALGSGGGSGVSTVAAADATILVGGTSSNPTLKVPSGTFDAAGAASAAQSAAIAASDPAGSASAAQAASLQKTQNLGDIANPTSARLNLGVTALTPCQVVTNSNITLSGLQAINGYTTLSGDRVLVTAQTTASQNGVWLAAAGAWTRPADYASGAGISGGRSVEVLNGTDAPTRWLLITASAATVDATATSWALAYVPPFYMADPNVPDGTTDNTSYLAARLASAMALGYTLRIPAGRRGVWIVNKFTLPTNAAVDATGASFGQASGVNTRMVLNTSCTLGSPGSVRDSNISWIGGTFIKGPGQQNAGVLDDILVMFGFVDGLTFKNYTASQSGTGSLSGTGGTYGGYLYNVTNFVVENYTAISASQAVNQSTLQTCAGCSNGRIKGVYGTFGDDCVALGGRNTAYEITGQIGVDHTQNIVIEDVFASSPSNGVRIFAGSTAGVAPFYNVQQIQIRNMRGNWGSRGSCFGVGIGAGVSNNTNISNAFIYDVEIENVTQLRAATPAVGLLSSLVNQTPQGIVCRAVYNQGDTYAVDIQSALFATVKVCDAVYNTSITTGSYYPVHLATASARNIELENIRVNAATTGTASVAPLLLAATCGGVHMRNVSVTGKAYTTFVTSATTFCWLDGVNSEDANGLGIFQTNTGGAVTVFSYRGHTSGGVAGFVQTAGTVATQDENLPGANGSAVLVAGTVVVNTGSGLVTASSKIRLTTLTPGGTVGHCYVSARGANTFTITSTSNTDTSTIFWEIVSS